MYDPVVVGRPQSRVEATKAEVAKSFNDCDFGSQPSRSSWRGCPRPVTARVPGKEPSAGFARAIRAA